MDVMLDLSVMWDGSVEVKDTSLVFGDVEVKLRSEQLENLRKALGGWTGEVVLYSF